MATTKKVKFNKSTYKYTPKSKNYGKSKVVPSESMSVRAMLHRHANGINFDNVKTPFYEDQATLSSTSIHELQKMDLTDKLQYLQEHGDKVNALKTKIQAYKTEQETIAQKNETAKTNANDQTNAKETPVD